MASLGACTRPLEDPIYATHGRSAKRPRKQHDLSLSSLSSSDDHRQPLLSETKSTAPVSDPAAATAAKTTRETMKDSSLEEQTYFASGEVSAHREDQYGGDLFGEEEGDCEEDSDEDEDKDQHPSRRGKTKRATISATTNLKQQCVYYVPNTSTPARTSPKAPATTTIAKGTHRDRSCETSSQTTDCHAQRNSHISETNERERQALKQTQSSGGENTVVDSTGVRAAAMSRRKKGGAPEVARRGSGGGGERERNGYECMDCGKVFSKPCKLVRHATIHTGEKPFVCQEHG